MFHRIGVLAMLLVASQAHAQLTFENLSDRIPCQILGFGLGTEPKGNVDIRWPSGYRNRVYGVHAGEQIAFPEIPCSYDDPSLSFEQYRQCVNDALEGLKEQGIILPEQSGRLLSSALRAYHDAR